MTQVMGGSAGRRGAAASVGGRVWVVRLILVLLLSLGVSCSTPQSVVIDSDQPEDEEETPSGTAENPFVSRPREVTLLTRDKVEVKASYYPSLQKKKGPGVILAHAWGRSRSEWDTFAKRLARAGYGAIAVDLRGHGGSTKQGRRTLDPSKFGKDEVRKMFNDLDAAHQFLREQDEIDSGRIAGIGSEFGANLTIHFASSQPLVAGIVLISPTADALGLNTAISFSNYRDRPALIIAASQDSVSSQTARMLATFSDAEVQTLQGRGRGTNLFRQFDELEDMILLWLDGWI